MPKTYTISADAVERLKKMAESYMPADEYADWFYDVATWGNVDDSMHAASDQSDAQMAYHLLKDITEVN